jgi:hypothetical protein
MNVKAKHDQHLTSPAQAHRIQSSLSDGCLICRYPQGLTPAADMPPAKPVFDTKNVID